MFVSPVSSLHAGLHGLPTQHWAPKPLTHPAHCLPPAVGSLPPERTIPPAILRGAAGLAVLSVARVGAGWSLSVGSGLVVARTAEGGWSAPSALLSLASSIGWQIGLEVQDLVRGDGGVDTLWNSQTAPAGTALDDGLRLRPALRRQHASLPPTASQPPLAVLTGPSCFFPPMDPGAGPAHRVGPQGLLLQPAGGGRRAVHRGRAGEPLRDSVSSMWRLG